MPEAATIERLKARAKIVTAVRAFFDGQGFVEVETPVRIAAPAPEPHIDCPVVPSPTGGSAHLSPGFTRTSDEEALGGGDGPHLPDWPLLPGGGARFAPQSRVHDD